MLLSRPDSNLQTSQPTDFLHVLTENRHRSNLSRPVDPHHHRKQLFGIAVIHLNFKDVSARARDVMHNRIGQAPIVRSNRSNSHLHEIVTCMSYSVFPAAQFRTQSGFPPARE
jgi:hypothetical protein